ncbi:hypothetical protein AD428_21660 [Achromobacter sp. DMS1]|nr:hypothetical protein AD428_21660 [Achromobacter sp. DMS1]
MWDACGGLVDAVHNLLRHYRQIGIMLLLLLVLLLLLSASRLLVFPAVPAFAACQDVTVTLFDKDSGLHKGADLSRHAADADRNPCPRGSRRRGWRVQRGKASLETTMQANTGDP